MESGTLNSFRAEASSVSLSKETVKLLLRSSIFGSGDRDEARNGGSDWDSLSFSQIPWLAHQPLCDLDPDDEEAPPCTPLATYPLMTRLFSSSPGRPCRYHGCCPADSPSADTPGAHLLDGSSR